MIALLRIIALFLLILLVPWLAWVAYVNLTGRENSIWYGGRPSTLGLHDGRLGPPKHTPNSVVSEGIPDTHPAWIAPIRFTDDPRSAMARLLTALGEMEGVTLLKADERYVYAECRTRRLRFVDDLEARIDPEAKLIHVRSASRLGRRDFDVNRARIERLRQRLAQR